MNLAKRMNTKVIMLLILKLANGLSEGKKSYTQKIQELTKRGK